jgi:hypothetical protein
MNLNYTPEQNAFRAEVRAGWRRMCPRKLVTLECREGYDLHRAWEAQRSPAAIGAW